MHTGTGWYLPGYFDLLDIEAEADHSSMNNDMLRENHACLAMG